MAQLHRHGFLLRRCIANRSVLGEINRRFANVAAKVRPLEIQESQTEPKKDLTHGLNWYSALLRPEFATKVAFRDGKHSFTYNDIASAAYANHLKLEEDFKVEKTIKSKRKTLHGKRIGIFTSHDVSFVISLWSTWLSGGIAVPLGIKHPEPQLEYFLKNSDTSVILCSKDTQERAEKIAKVCGAEILPIFPTVSSVTNPGALREAILPLAPPADDKALILYTSGTTGQPKGVLWKHDALVGQVEAMLHSWQWSPNDTLLHVLPLYHLHGLVNCLLTPLSCGAAVWMDQEFSPAEVWRKMLSKEEDRISVFMAVPTIYVKLLEFYHANKQQMPSAEEIRRICMSKMRLMVSGSAPLPDTVFRAWKDLTGHELLERYGMTETGMILSNPINGPRIPGTVGTPLPNVQARIVPAPEEKPAVEAPPVGKSSFLGLKSKEEKKIEETAPPVGGKSSFLGLKKTEETAPSVGKSSFLGLTSKEEKQIMEETAPPVGELQVTGPNMFTSYWNNEKATSESFSDDGWFRTGDTAELRPDGVYRLLGRTSSEIIKSGGFKLSALDVERRLHEHPDVLECAVFGVPDDVWGEKIVCLLKISPNAAPELTQDSHALQKNLASFVAKSLPAYAAPKEIKLVEELPRNAMGKINKKELSKNFIKSQQKIEQASPTAEKLPEKSKTLN